jgi:hypothetical protein
LGNETKASNETKHPTPDDKRSTLDTGGSVAAKSAIAGLDGQTASRGCGRAFGGAARLAEGAIVNDLARLR